MVRFEEGHLVYYAVAGVYVCVYAHWVSHPATSFDRLIPGYANVTRVKNDRVACHDSVPRRTPGKELSANGTDFGLVPRILSRRCAPLTLPHRQPN